MNIVEKLIDLSLKEDIGSGDITSEAVIRGNEIVSAVVCAKETLVVAGIDICALVFKAVEDSIKIKARKKDGDVVKRGDVLLSLQGRARGVLTAERTALNFLQHLSGIATLTREFVTKAKGHVRVLDTRKTIPAWRVLEKYAVKVGGGVNHRMGLYDMYLVKNNHVDIAGSVTEAIMRVRRGQKKGKAIEVEVRDMPELREALILGIDVVMLDNFTPTKVREAVIEMKKFCRKLNISAPLIEISGNIDICNVREYAKAGADFISVGCITHSARAVDIHLSVL